jgi:hypothetical protein
MGEGLGSLRSAGERANVAEHEDALTPRRGDGEQGSRSPLRRLTLIKSGTDYFRLSTPSQIICAFRRRNGDNRVCLGVVGTNGIAPPLPKIPHAFPRNRPLVRRGRKDRGSPQAYRQSRRADPRLSGPGEARGNRSPVAAAARRRGDLRGGDRAIPALPSRQRLVRQRLRAPARTATSMRSANDLIGLRQIERRAGVALPPERCSAATRERRVGWIRTASRTAVRARSACKARR